MPTCLYLLLVSLLYSNPPFVIVIASFGSLPPPFIKVTLPRRAAAVTASASGETGGAVGAGGDGVGGVGGWGGSGEGDGGLIAKKVARQMSERKKREGVLFVVSVLYYVGGGAVRRVCVVGWWISSSPSGLFVCILNCMCDFALPVCVLVFFFVSSFPRFFANLCASCRAKPQMHHSRRAPCGR